MTDRIELAMRDGVAQVSLNRPDKYNAVDRGMFDALIETGAILAADKSLRAVVLHGNGDNFCAGIDISVFQGGGDGIDPAAMQPQANSLANYFQSASWVWRDLPVPVIAALHGAVFGAGLQIALGADIRIASESATLSVMEIKWGIIPDMGISVALPALMPYDKALELTSTGRKVSGTEAASLGLVTSTADDPLVSALDLAGRIAGQSPDAIRAAKALFREAWADREAALLRREAELQMKVMGAPNHKEAIMANMQKRAPEFGDAAT
jgi:enoyl-CoA hydratase/carnithine racemase